MRNTECMDKANNAVTAINNAPDAIEGALYTCDMCTLNYADECGTISFGREICQL